jgi:uncharacterized protein (TIGR04141 family)
MLAAVAAEQSDKCRLAVPEPIDWASVAGFKYGTGARRAVVHDIHLQSFLQDHGLPADDVTVAYLKQHRVLAVDGDGAVQHNWPVYRCLYCEVEDGSNTYLLSGGHWYKVASDFVGQVNEYYARLPVYAEALPAYKDPSEGAYAERVAKESNGKFALMDRRLISIGGGHSRVEFCDLFSRGKDLIHIKRYGGAGVLAHLFSQGVVSGQLFVSDEGFRQAINGKLPAAHRLADVERRPNAEDFRVVFAVVSSERGDRLTLPFFSRLNVRHAAQSLLGYGYKVELAKIAVAETMAKTTKFAASRRA